MTSLAERVRRVAPELGPAQRRVAEAVLREYPVVALERLADIAALADVSPPTVLRFVAKLGFSSVEEFRSAAREEIGERLASPLERLEVTGPGDVGSAEADLIDQIRRSFVGLAPHSLDTVVTLLADVRRPVVVSGGRVSDVVARHLAWTLEVLRPSVRHVPPEAGARVNALLDVDASTTVVAFDFVRYQLETARFVTAASQAGATVVLVTDPGLSPAAPGSTVVLTTQVDGPGIFDALTPALALVEAIIAAVVQRIGEPARRRLARYEELTRALVEVER